jgi:hypothetical protein
MVVHSNAPTLFEKHGALPVSPTKKPDHITDARERQQLSRGQRRMQVGCFDLLLRGTLRT